MEEKIIEYLEGKMPEAEISDFLHLIESNRQLKDTFVRMQNTRALLNMLPEKKDEFEGKSGYLRFMQIVRRKTGRKILMKIAACAATGALLVVGTYFFAGGFSERSNSAMNEIFVPAGQRVRLTLGDGSKVWLNAKSTLKYPSDFSSERCVTLSGEAFFEVTADPERPFMVTAKGLNIVALGTKFNVCGYPDDGVTQASLVEGCIKVRCDSGQEILLSPNRKVRLENGKMISEPAEHADYFLWTEGIYSFENEPLRNIIRKLERYYDVKIETKNLSILDCEYTGKFRQRDGVDMILRLMQKIHPFRFERKDDVYTLKE